MQFWGFSSFIFTSRSLSWMYVSLKPGKQCCLNPMLHHRISMLRTFLVWLCVMSVQWNLVLIAERRCPLARRCAQNFKADDRPACERPQNYNAHAWSKVLHKQGSATNTGKNDPAPLLFFPSSFWILNLLEIRLRWCQRGSPLSSLHPQTICVVISMDGGKLEVGVVRYFILELRGKALFFFSLVTK